METKTLSELYIYSITICGIIITNDLEK